jgi:adenosylcobinamide kinase/adenosylcobinamide-phosphate guanylyltransferase
MIYFITGGERSGKSRYAQQLALGLSAQPVYLATARKWDADFENRIQRHQQERDSRWINLEEEKYLSRMALKHQAVVIDCVTLWLTNFYTDHQYNWEAALTEARNEFDLLAQQPADFIIISNEIGMGVHADTAIGRKFVELQGWMNQHIAARADQVFFMVSGIALKVK